MIKINLHSPRVHVFFRVLYWIIILILGFAEAGLVSFMGSSLGPRDTTSWVGCGVFALVMGAIIFSLFRELWLHHKSVADYLILEDEGMRIVAFGQKSSVDWKKIEKIGMQAVCVAGRGTKWEILPCLAFDAKGFSWTGQKVDGFFGPDKLTSYICLNYANSGQIKQLTEIIKNAGLELKKFAPLMDTQNKAEYEEFVKKNFEK